MLNLIILIGCFLAVPAAVGKFLDEVWLLDGQKRRLRDKFSEWWIVAVDYDRVKFVLAWILAFNRLVDVFLGEKLFSKRAFFRCLVLATGFLVASLAFTGLLNHQILGIMPWASYHESCKAVSDYADFIAGSGITQGKLIRTDVSISMTNATTSIYLLPLNCFHSVQCRRQMQMVKFMGNIMLDFTFISGTFQRARTMKQQHSFGLKVFRPLKMA